MAGVKSTVDNLQEAIAGETHEFKNMYPAMIEAAKAEDEKAASTLLYLCQRSGKGPCCSL